jgi:hypothetical protein
VVEQMTSGQVSNRICIRSSTMLHICYELFRKAIRRAKRCHVCAVPYDLS